MQIVLMSLALFFGNQQAKAGLKLKKEKSAKCDKFSAYENFQSAQERGIAKIKHKNDQYLSPTRDQDGIGYCYAYAGADMLENWLKRKGHMPKDKHISAMGMGISYQADDWEKVIHKFEALGNFRDANLGLIKKKEKEIEALREKNKKLGRMISAEKKIARKKEGELFNELRVKHKDFKKLEEHDNKFMDLMAAGKKDEAKKELMKKMALEQQIEHGIENSPEFKKEVEKFRKKLGELEEERKKIRKERRHKIKVLKEIMEKIMPESDLVPEGGLAYKAINKAWSRLCFESEISSRDEALKMIYEKYKEKFKDEAFAPKDFEYFMGYLALKQYEKERNLCIEFDLAKSVFKNMSFSDPHDFYNFMKSLSPGDLIFKRLLNESCSEKTFPLKPEFEKLSAPSRDVPVKNNDKLFHAIDKALEKGEIATINYRSNILNNKKSHSKIEDYHASTIVGSLGICGEPYYILRNTWGQGSCREKERSLLMTTDDLGDDKEFESCMKIGLQKIESSLKTCRSPEHCKGIAVEGKERVKSDCKDESFNKMRRQRGHPYFCDSQGNFIVSKKFLAQGVYEVETISN